VRPGSLLAWERVRIANMGASGAEWVEFVSAHNSGTYNNQYMVVDLKRFQPGRALLDGLLTVVEQIPGEADGIVFADMTQLLVLGYWPSFNVPFFDKVYRKSGCVHSRPNSCDNAFIAETQSALEFTVSHWNKIRL
jgi:hypothetical protein